MNWPSTWWPLCCSRSASSPGLSGSEGFAVGVLWSVVWSFVGLVLVLLSVWGVYRLLDGASEFSGRDR